MSKWELFVKQFITNSGWETVLSGLGATVLIAVLGLLLGIAIGTLLAIAKVVPQYKLSARIASALTDIYTTIFRGIPMVVQLLLGYYVIMPAIGINADSLTVAIIVFGLNSGAYICEIMRGGIQSVDRGQLEAGRAVGLSYGATMGKVVLPQAVKNIVPTLGNEFITLIKETSVVSFIAVVDLTKAFRALASASYEYVIPYIMLAVIYLVLVLGITVLVKFTERRFNKSDKRN